MRHPLNIPRLGPALVLAASLGLGAPAAAQDADTREGLDLLGDGARMILEGLMDDMRPMLEDMQPFLEQDVLPMLERMGELVDDLSAYELPERLPNGDIIIRRSPDAPTIEDLPPHEDGGEVEL